MRDLVENKIEHFKKTENQLMGAEWDDIYFSVSSRDTKLVRDVDYEKLNEVHLLRFLLYLTKMQDSVIDKRIRNES